ncbi:hypothetical protein V8C86DRAFT_436397 [Haematococcus lacustris]
MMMMILAAFARLSGFTTAVCCLSPWTWPPRLPASTAAYMPGCVDDGDSDSDDGGSDKEDGGGGSLAVVMLVVVMVRRRRRRRRRRGVMSD